MKNSHGVKMTNGSALLLILVLIATGCNSITKRGQSPDGAFAGSEVSQEFIGGITSIWGLSYAKVEGIAMATQLDGKGSDPRPSQQRAYLVSEMRAHDVAKPNEVLASDDTSLVLVRGFMPPGVRKGDRFDVEIRTLPRSDTKSLRGGFLMETRLRQMEAMGGQVLKGHVVGTVKGPIVVDSVFDKTDPMNETRGRIMGTAISKYDRPLGLAVTSENHSIRVVSAITRSINERFFVIDNGGQVGAATAKNDRHIELAVPLRYKHNLARYLEVVRSIKYRESQSELAQRLITLEEQLLEPTTSKRASLQLEAVGDPAKPVLEKGLVSNDAEVRFNSAMALAYLDVPGAARELGSAAKVYPAFRWHAMTALASMDDIEAGMQLHELLNLRSAETRYGAFQALRVRSPEKNVYESDVRPEDFYVHVVPSESFPLMHFSRYKRPELALFGGEQTVGDNFLFVESGLTIRALGDGKVKIAKFSQRESDNSQVVSSKVADVVRALVDLGMNYGEIIEIFQSAKSSGMLNSKLVVDATPKPNRKFERKESVAGDEQDAEDVVTGPVPDLFRGSTGQQQKWRPNSTADFYEEEEPAKKGFFTSLTSWWSN